MKHHNIHGRHRQKRHWGRWKPGMLDLWMVMIGLGAILATGLGISPTASSAPSPVPRTPEAMTSPHRAITVALRIPLLRTGPAVFKRDVVLDAIKASGGRYVWAAASLGAADCSGLVSVALSLAEGQPLHRIGDTHSLMAGQWPGMIRGASPDDAFVVGVSPSHMVARVNGTNIESRSHGMPYLIGPAAKSPWDPEFTEVWHADPALLVAL